ncbi:MAG: site-specific integrase [Atopobiaceae bacterium]|nr:site-specific integrase [Atopobiaceae bacterium]
MNGSELVRIRHTKDGTPYARPYLGTTRDGKPWRPYREFPGMGDAEALEAAQVWVAGLLDDSRDVQGMTLGEALERYVRRLEATGHAPNTVRTYRRCAKVYAASVADMPLAEVDAQTMDDLLFHLLTEGGRDGKGLSRSTVSQVKHFLSGAFRHYAAMGAMPGNPMASTMRISTAGEVARALDPGDLRKLCAEIARALHEDGTDSRNVFRRNAALGMLLALNAGVRVGEACGLRRADLDAEARAVNVCGTVVEPDGLPPYRQTTTKSKASRSVPVPASVTEAVGEHLVWQRAYLARARRETPLLTLDGTCMRPRDVSGEYARVRDALGIDRTTTFHSLRHTHASGCIRAGIDARTLQERLGHADVATTLRKYGHLWPGRDREAADAFGAFLDTITEGEGDGAADVAGG